VVFGRAQMDGKRATLVDPFTREDRKLIVDFAGLLR
jgi:hypothetical protein